MSAPLITFVKYARNDGYTPDFLGRMELAISVLARQAIHYQVAIEILIVEWNPPLDHSPLKDAIKIDQTSEFVSVRFIRVPPEEHARCALSNAKGMHPARALNVGYRRARGKFVTPKSSDSFLSDETFEFFASGLLDKGKIYRLTRYDIEPDALAVLQNKKSANGPLNALFKKHVKGCHLPQDDQLSKPLGLPALHTNAAGDFLLMAKEKWCALKGQPEDTDVLCLDTDSITLHAAVTHNLIEERLPDTCRVYKPVHGNMSNSRVALVWNSYSRFISAFARLISRSPRTRAYIRGIFNIPRRQLAGIEGAHASFEKNFFLRVKNWPQQDKPIALNGQDWGLGNKKLEET
jgi:hypothetical protein